MGTWNVAMSIVLVVGGSGICAAQIVPGVPAGAPTPPPVPLAPAVPIAPVPTVAGGSKCLAFFEGVSHAHAVHKARFRASPLGQLLQNAKRPLSALTGGIIPAEHTPSAIEMQAPGAAGVAAAIKKDQMEAPQRIQAIQALAKVDLARYPEAEQQLIAALRCDAVECVRWEAAKALTLAGCCSKPVVEALRIVVSGSDKDGNPPERSMRVRDQACAALDHCLAFAPANLKPEPLPRPEQPIRPTSGESGSVVIGDEPAVVRQLAYYHELHTPPQTVVRHAEVTLQQFRDWRAARSPRPTSLSEIWTATKPPEPPSGPQILSASLPQ